MLSYSVAGFRCTVKFNKVNFLTRKDYFVNSPIFGFLERSNTCVQVYLVLELTGIKFDLIRKTGNIATVTYPRLRSVVAITHGYRI